jgi:hypothetical protein
MLLVDQMVSAVATQAQMCFIACFSHIEALDRSPEAVVTLTAMLMKSSPIARELYDVNIFS